MFLHVKTSNWIEMRRKTTQPNVELAKLELKHIQLEIISKRGQLLRHFVGQYFCYKKGYIKKNWHC